MATKTKKNNKKAVTVENAIDAATLVNTVALTTVETVVTKGFDVVEKMQAKTDSLLKKVFGFSAKKSDEMFDSLDASKEKAVKTLKKVTKRFSKKAA